MYAILRGNSNYSNSKNNMYVVIMVIYRVFFLEFYKEYLMEIYLQLRNDSRVFKIISLIQNHRKYFMMLSSLICCSYALAASNISCTKDISISLFYSLFDILKFEI